ncbi:hypothetical protein [Rugosimonospora africana]|uniref:Cytidylate kinase n=1 Tax=Rugosimonospora africana TaxID=556532 RepID=A0A8J3QYW8_9ACTN|nr:hypothetical protein [Rugosimonospora africana]GIH18617.1 hypothetical protein Raf01_67890 [Rugosimonospora africana]
MIFRCAGVIVIRVYWDPFTTLRHALWIGGAQWAGKSTVAGILAHRYGLTCYRYDYHDARGHQDRWIAQRCRHGEAVPDPDPDPEAAWVRTTPPEMARQAIERFHQRFAWVQDDLRALSSPRPVVAEGWGLRPELIATVTESLRRVVVMVPTEDFRRRQLRVLPRAHRAREGVSDPRLAQRNRLERNRIVGEDAVRNARRLGVRVIEVDGTRDATAVADALAAHWEPFLSHAG